MHLTDRQGSFDRVYPIGAGTIDDRHGSRTYGESRSAYPVFKRGNDFTIDSATINACRIWWSDPDSGKLLPVFAGLPFIRFYGPYGIHGPISKYWKENGGELHRGYVSHGCIRMEAADVAELWAYIRDTPKVPLHIQLPIERDAAGQALDVSPRFIGAECTDDAQCDFEGGLCQRSGDDARAGFCTKRCDRICADRLDYPTTYCVDAAKVGASDSSDGRCVPVSNDQSHSCRRFAVLAPSAATPRHGQPEVTRDVCLPAE